MSIPEVQWFVRGPKVAIFEMPSAVDIDVSGLGPKAPPRALKVDGTEEIDPNDILAEFPAELQADAALQLRADDVLARAATLDQEDTRPSMRTYQAGRTGWLVALVAGTTVGIVLATALSIYAAAPIARAPRPHVKAQAVKALVPSAATLGRIVPTVSIDSLPRAR
jgi:hypothetical protein